MKITCILLSKSNVSVLIVTIIKSKSVVRMRRWAGGNRVEWAGPETLAGCGRLAWLDLRRNPLSRLHPRSLDRLPNLETLSVISLRFYFNYFNL